MVAFVGCLLSEFNNDKNMKEKLMARMARDLKYMKSQGFTANINNVKEKIDGDYYCLICKYDTVPNMD